ncbi:hypothetical protein KQX54_001746 [Cotesia glomerata]|uniref:Uncharacterized protein n=1 Tax=Cotesia glomerata TaxID=32391 RepID=A0AAV7ITN1_COTGL|nr:hypothetical protein KQX54_001746 [Cotesia glomerata]
MVPSKTNPVENNSSPRDILSFRGTVLAKKLDNTSGVIRVVQAILDVLGKLDFSAIEASRFSDKMLDKVSPYVTFTFVRFKVL